MLSLVLVLFVAAAAKDITLTRPFSNLVVHSSDSPKLLLADYFMGSGKRVLIEPVAGIESQAGAIRVLKEVANMSLSRQECIEAIRQDEQIVSLCDGHILSKIDFSAPDQGEKLLDLGQTLECHDVMTSAYLEGFLVVCQTKGTAEGRPLKFFKISHDTFEQQFTFELEQKPGQNIDTSEENTHITFENDFNDIKGRTTVILYTRFANESQLIRLRAFAITGKNKEDIVDIGYFDADSIDAPTKGDKSCRLNELKLDDNVLQLSVYCSSVSSNFYLSCVYPVENENLNCPEILSIVEKVPSAPLKEKLIRDYTGVDSTTLYAANGSKLFVLDFAERKRKLLFEFEDGDFSENSPTSFAVFNGVFYVLRVESDSVYFYAVNIEKNFYIKELVTKLDSSRPWLNTLHLLYDETFFGGKKPEVYIVSLTSKIAKAFMTRDFLLSVDMDAARKLPPNEEGFAVLPCKIDIICGQSKDAIDFNVTVYSNFSVVQPEYDLVSRWKVYRGLKKAQLPVTKEDMKGSLFDLKSSLNSQFTAKNFDAFPVALPKDLLTIQALVSTEGRGILLSTGTTYQILDCRVDEETRSSNMSCSIRYRAEVPERHNFLSFLMFDELTYVLLQSSSGVVLQAYDNRGVKVNETTLEVASGIAQLREFNDLVFLEVVYVSGRKVILNYTSFQIGKFIEPSDMKVFDRFYNQLYPIGIKRGPRRFNSVFIEGDSNERFAIFELKYNLANKPMEVLFTVLDTGEERINACYFTKFTVLVDYNKLAVTSILRSVDPNPRKVYPFKELGIEEILDVVCNMKHSHLIVLGKNTDRETMLTVFRIEDGSEEMFRRVHSSVTLENDRTSIVAISGAASEDSAVILTAVDGTEEIKGHIYQVSAPIVSLNVTAAGLTHSENQPVFFNFTSLRKQEKLSTHKVDLYLVDQDTSVELGVFGKLPLDSKGHFHLDSYLFIDGLNVTGQLLRAEHIDSSNMNVKQRLRVEPVKDITLFQAKYTRLISLHNITFGWSKDEAMVYETTAGSVVTFKSSAANFKDCWFVPGSQQISCYLRDSDNQPTRFFMIEKDQKGRWVEYRVVLSFQTQWMRNFRVSENLFGYAMLDVKSEMILVGVTRNYEGGYIIPQGRSISVASNHIISTFDAVSVQNRLVVIKNERMSNIVTLLEYAYDPRLENMAMKRSFKLPLFKTDASDFFLPSFLKCSTIENKDNSTDLFCFAAQEGVHSYVCKFGFKNEADRLNTDGAVGPKAPAIEYSRKVFNVQGYTTRKVKVYRNWATVITTKNRDATKRPPGLDQELLLLVYLIDWKYSHPFAVIPTADLNLTSDQWERINLSFETETNGRLRVSLFTYNAKQSNILRSFSIGSFELFISADAESKKRGTEMLKFVGVNKGKEQTIDFDRIFNPKEEEFVLLSFLGRMIFLSILIVILFIMLIAVVNACVLGRRVHDLDSSEDLIAEDGEIVRGADPLRASFKKKEVLKPSFRDPHSPALLDPMLSTDEQRSPSQSN